MATLYDLAERMETLAATLEKEGSRCAIETAKVVQRYLSVHTPVDTSQALSNWDISIGTLTTEFHEPYYLGRKGSTKLASANASNFEAAQRLKDKKPGQTIFVSNAAPYIRGLNDGTISRQPSGFVEESVIVGKQYVKTFKLKLG